MSVHLLRPAVPAIDRALPQAPVVRRKVLVTIEGQTAELGGQGAKIVRSGDLWKSLFPPDPAYAALCPRASSPA